ncbi:FAD-dependent monooxygenase [Ferrimonas lipolytica]|uniref:2-octaprenyl-3-methyl-6-methoxy-1,4-benzoquinol hydroxylase n=1 Tax=Ferrimonas lipolytica TaxID=2724191 RepID=A0A6H1UAA3_9GAMM|nr:FAD-dependent monooxygenase [Ferrimonas lipolytica]QIZ75964.1 2-octaprenyl-3-methyl-6-methoxy-1,4-benzoquinol hydroxylase [Ferrimonas lipolytica]
MSNHFDVLIVGAGMVGAAAAIALGQQGWSVGLIETNQPQAFEPEQPMDLRVSAISAASEQLLQSLGAWDAIAAMRVTPYDTLATWEWHDSEVSFCADDLQHSHLGHIVENRVVQLGLWQQLQQLDNVTLVLGQSPTDISQNEAGVSLVIGDERYHTSLLLGCDGAQSKVRQAAQIGVTGWNYRHHCLIINIATEMEQQRITWQQFFPSGPRAFLPLTGKQGSLVWYDSPERIAELKRLDKSELAEQITLAFPERLGAFEVERLASFPLTRQHAQRYYHNRMVLLGDSAHTINPLAGQGVNLGFKDVAALAEVMAKVHRSELEADIRPELAKYERLRRNDNLRMQGAMDLFYNVFSNDILPLKLVRNIGFKIAQNAGPIKHQVMRYAMGL